MVLVWLREPGGLVRLLCFLVRQRVRLSGHRRHPKVRKLLHRPPVVPGERTVAGPQRPGDLIFFDWDDEDEGQDGAADHVGIVEKADGGIVYTVEGNSGDSCRENRYAIGHYEIYGYGTPTY